MQSMTGYGKSEVLLPDQKITVEIKSLNSKNIDINLKIPNKYREKELDIRKMIQSRLNRGKIDVILFSEMNGGNTPVNINRDSFKRYYEQISELAAELGLHTGSEIIESILKLPDTIRMEQDEINENEWEIIQQGIEEALTFLNQFRQQEGEAMDNDLSDRISNILHFLGQVNSHEEVRMKHLKERIKKALDELALSEELNDNRFEQEMIYYLEKLDISEEKTRLMNHCRYFTETQKSEEPVGKKLSFISQEIGREINTIGSKANNSDIQHIVVKMKDELEKIKEQLLNVL